MFIGPSVLWVTLYPHFIWPLTNIFMTASMYMTVAISIDRYIVVCYPFKYYNENCLDLKRPQKCRIDTQRVLKYFWAVSGFSVMFCIPSFFDYQVSKCADFDYKTVKWTELRKMESYIFTYLVFVDIVVRYLIPIVVLLYTNSRHEQPGLLTLYFFRL